MPLLEAPGDESRRSLMPRLRIRLPHVHQFRWAREDPFSPHNIYVCRCGVARHGL